MGLIAQRRANHLGTTRNKRPQPFALDVTLVIHGKDKYGRILADVLLADETNVNHVLVKDGWCWWYWKYGRRKYS
jgi:endonuclease YncB( thermonuclease family)